MNISAFTQTDSLCRYLFNQEAKSLFNKVKFSNSNKTEELVDQCLDLIMRVHVFLLTYKDAFFLLDPLASNNQCHLYSLMAARVKTQYPLKTFQEKLARTDENRFIHLSLFLAHPFLKHNHTLFLQAVKKGREELKQVEQLPIYSLTEEDLAVFLEDKKGCREKAARQALISLFKLNLETNLSTFKTKEEGLYSELSLMAQEKSLLSDKQFYTYPKLAGVVYMVDCLARENIPFVIKVRVLTKSGVAGTLVEASRPLQKGEAAIIFEGIASDGSVTVQNCLKYSRSCLTSFFQEKSLKKVHKEKESCFFCHPSPQDLKPLQLKIKDIMQNSQQMFYMLGADFTAKVQPQFHLLFEDEQRYPLLAKIYKEALLSIKGSGLDMDSPTTFSVCHAYLDTDVQALSEEMILSTPPEILLKKRGIL